MTLAPSPMEVRRRRQVLDQVLAKMGREGLSIQKAAVGMGSPFGTLKNALRGDTDAGLKLIAKCETWLAA